MIVKLLVEVDVDTDHLTKTELENITEIVEELVIEVIQTTGSSWQDCELPDGTVSVSVLS